MLSCNTVLITNLSGCEARYLYGAAQSHEGLSGSQRCALLNGRAAIAGMLRALPLDLNGRSNAKPDSSGRIAQGIKAAVRFSRGIRARSLGSTSVSRSPLGVVVTPARPNVDLP